MQPVVIGQAPLSLERKISSGGKQILTEHNTTTETYRIPQTRKIKRWARMRYIAYSKRVSTFAFLSVNVSGLLACACRTFLSYPVRWQVISLLLHYIVVCLVSWFCDQSLYLSRRKNPHTDTECAGCRREKIPVWCEEHTHSINRNRGNSNKTSKNKTNNMKRRPIRSRKKTEKKKMK